uniref:RING-type domain-containing protein n=1 Tax=Branchiostoma floridae TaxID=7739 RepID=C3Y0U4_BRAFL|eukprot:XP_002610067.1 hypothetical protein BRAFLDRAFT_125681 [Branchiostoma floridae]
MGYSLQRFLSRVDDNLLCGICAAVLKDAVVTPCGHSFCEHCLDTWLNQTERRTCPECRSGMLPHEARPVIALRSLISGLSIECLHRERGCRMTLKLEDEQRHQAECGYSPAQCSTCGDTMDRYRLANHELQCSKVTAEKEEKGDADFLTRRKNSASGRFDLALSELACRVATLEVQLKQTRHELEMSRARNRRLERELQRRKSELEAQKSEMRGTSGRCDTQLTTFQSASQLSQFISRYLLIKPHYVNKDHVFRSIRDYFDHYIAGGDGMYHNDVHALVATAYASNWFSPSQRLCIQQWLRTLSRRSQEITGHRTNMPDILPLTS